jgi:hypothetical protein
MRKLLIPISITFILSACGNDEVYTLYRTGVGFSDMRIHVATFDSDDSRDSKFQTYNLDNCRLAASLFQNQPNVTTKYWCEKGRYKK